MTDDAQLASHPIGLIVDDDLKRNRLTVFFRILLAIPQLIWIVIWSIAASLVLLASWIAGLILGEIPEGMHNFNARFLRLNAHVNAYLFLLADPWPPFMGEPGTYPVDLRVAPPAKQSRLTIFFRLFLAIPAFIVSYVFRLVNEIVAFLAWFYCLFTGHMHEGMRNLSAWMLRYEFQTHSYVFLLTGRYPSFEGSPTA
jgi:uncharacterized protein DUF4389